MSASELDRLAASVSVQRLAEARGIGLVRRGEELVGRCPFHDDDRESLLLRPAENRWLCLGSCGMGGGPVEWVMRAEGVSHRHAVELLRVGVPAGRGRQPLCPPARLRR